MKLISALIVCTLFLWHGPAFALITANACKGCTQQQYDNAASGIANTQHAGKIYIYDLTNNNFKKYRIEADPIFGSYSYYAAEETPLATETGVWNQAKAAIEANHGSSTFFGTFNSQTTPGFPNPSQGIYDILQTSAYQNDISDYFMTGRGSALYPTDAASTISSLINMAGQIVLKSDLISMTVKVITVDHGYIEFSWVAGTTHYVVQAAFDANNNSIPVTSSRVNGRYIFRNGGGSNFDNYLSDRFGIDFSGIRVCVNGILACTDAPAHSGHSCQWISCGGVA